VTVASEPRIGRDGHNKTLALLKVILLYCEDRRDIFVAKRSILQNNEILKILPGLGIA
jgi:hypothetical protein